MKKLFPFMVVLLVMTACNKTEPTAPIEPIIFSNAEIGQKFLYQRYAVNDCDLLPESFTWRNDTLVLEIIDLEESKIFLKESFTAYSENYAETSPHQYSLEFTDEGVLGLGNSHLLGYYYSDAIQMSPTSDTLEQSGCSLSISSSPPGAAYLPTFELGDIQHNDKSVLVERGVWVVDYLIYDDEAIYTSHSVFHDDLSPFTVSASGWNLIEQ